MCISLNVYFDARCWTAVTLNLETDLSTTAAEENASYLVLFLHELNVEGLQDTLSHLSMSTTISYDYSRCVNYWGQWGLLFGWA